MPRALGILGSSRGLSLEAVSREVIPRRTHSSPKQQTYPSVHHT